VPCRCRSPSTCGPRSSTRGQAPAAPPRRVLFVFIDGVGIGPDDADVNPFLQARLPVMRGLLGGRLPTLSQLTERTPGTAAPAAAETGLADPRGHLLPLGATLDMPGTPQSGTGQAALLTGEDAARTYGRHFGPWTPVRLRPVVEQRSILRRAMVGGRSVAFANAYPRGWPGPRGGRRIAAPPLAARAAGVLDRHEEALGDGSAVSSEIVNDGWKHHLGHDWLPDVTPREAGSNLGRIAAAHDLTLFAHYTTDTAGHRQDMPAAVEALERVDAFLGGIMHSLPADTVLIAASDHGNIEDVRGGHTRNPALGLLVRSGATADAATPSTALPTDLRHVAPFVLHLLGLDAATEG
jgi:2,3-bisphosphoglycerate-independent phosphoglycerate mutase